MILKDRNLRDQAIDQRFVKLRDGGGLLMDEILQVLDQTRVLKIMERNISPKSVNLDDLGLYFP